MDTDETRHYVRLKPEGRVSKTAKIFTGPKAPVIQCILIDYSVRGACVQLEKFVELPERFELMYGTTRKRCRMVWVRGLRVGVVF